MIDFRQRSIKNANSLVLTQDYRSSIFNWAIAHKLLHLLEVCFHEKSIKLILIVALLLLLLLPMLRCTTHNRYYIVVIAVKQSPCHPVTCVLYVNHYMTFTSRYYLKRQNLKYRVPMQCWLRIFHQNMLSVWGFPLLYLVSQFCCFSPSQIRYCKFMQFRCWFRNYLLGSWII